LVSCALFNTLHSQYFSGQGTRGGISRERFFLYVFLGSFFWYFVPGYLFQALSYFAWVTFIFPKSATVGALFGYHRGMGMSVITFDWAQIAYIGSPLATPWWAEANVFAGFVAIFWIIAPAIYVRALTFRLRYALILAFSSVTLGSVPTSPFQAAGALTILEQHTTSPISSRQNPHSMNRSITPTVRSS